MASFDVVSLFTNIVVEHTFKIIEDKPYRDDVSQYNGFSKKNFLNNCMIFVVEITWLYLITNCTSKSMAFLWDCVFRPYRQRFSLDIMSLVSLCDGEQYDI